MGTKREVAIGDFYIGENKQSIREITALVPEYDSVRYRTYSQSIRTGDYHCRNPEHESQCTRSALFNWAKGKAPAKVIAKLDVEGVRADSRRLKEERKNNIILAALKEATDDQIETEYKRRGLQTSIGFS